MVTYLEAKPHLFQLVAFVGSAVVLEFLIPLVGVLAPVDDTGHRWLAVAGNNNEVEVVLFSNRQRLVTRQDAQLIIVWAYNP